MSIFGYLPYTTGTTSRNSYTVKSFPVHGPKCPETWSKMSSNTVRNVLKHGPKCPQTRSEMSSNTVRNILKHGPKCPQIRSEMSLDMVRNVLRHDPKCPKWLWSEMSMVRNLSNSSCACIHEEWLDNVLSSILVSTVCVHLSTEI